ncbi:hypothetical protein [Pectobacterium polaris]|uniref:hypothetical protein n=1 Tax=Pectobacterium polaris TaxID=2042057 RepID=UPI0015E7FD09|nr:hypothetical protein [Pectobacterium polaris]
MNGELKDPEVAKRFDAVLKVVSDIAKADKDIAEKEKSEAEEKLILRKLNLSNNIIKR